MSDDERDEAVGPVEEQEPEIDEKGFHIIRTGGKLQNQVSYIFLYCSAPNSFINILFNSSKLDITLLYYILVG